MNFNLMKPEEVSPQSFVSNDGRFELELIDEDFFEITMTNLRDDQEGYCREEFDDIQKLTFASEDIDRLIEILECAKQINPYSWETIKEMQEKKEPDKCDKKIILGLI